MRRFFFLFFFILPGTVPLFASVETLSNDDLTFTVRKDNGAIEAAVFKGEDYFNDGTHLSDFAVVVDGLSGGYRRNTTYGNTGLPLVGSVSKLGNTIFSKVRYSVADYRLLIEREYTLIDGSNTVEVYVKATNEGSTSASFTYAEFFDPDIYGYRTYTERTTLDSGPVVYAWGALSSRSPLAFGVGTTDSESLVNVGSWPTTYNNFYSALRQGRSALDPNGGLADTATSFFRPMTLMPLHSVGFRYFLIFTDHPDRVESSFESNTRRLEIVDSSPNRTLRPGVSASLFVEVEANFPVSYEWRKDGVPIPDSNIATIELTDVTKAEDSGNYSVTVTDGQISRTTSITIEVNEAPVISNLPASITLFEGQDAGVVLARFTDADNDDRTLYGTAALSSNLGGDPQTSRDGNEMEVIIANPGRPGPPAEGVLDTGTLTITVNDGYGAVEQVIPVTVMAYDDPLVFEEVLPQQKLDTLTRNVRLNVYDEETAAADLVLEVESLTPSIVPTETLSSSLMPNGWHLIISDNPGVTGVARLRVTASAGIDSLTREFDVEVLQRPVFLSTPDDITVAEGDRVEVTTSVTGYPEPISTQLLKGVDGGSNEVIGSGTSHTFSSIQFSDAGMYHFAASNAAGAGSGNTFTIHVVEAAGIANVPGDTTIDLNDDLRVDPVLSGPGVTGIWYHNDEPLSSEPSSNPILLLESVAESASGTYELRASTDLSSASESFMLTVNSPPQVFLSESTVSIEEDGALTAFPFTIGDPDNSLGDLTISLSSLDGALIPDAPLFVGGTGENRTLNLSPSADQSGTAAVRVTVSDGRLSASEDLLVTITPVPDPIEINPIGAQEWDEDNSQLVTLSFVDIETPASPYEVTAVSGDVDLIPASGLILSGSGKNWTLEMVPEDNAFGESSITVTVTDGDRSSEMVVPVSVLPVNDAPTLELGVSLVETTLNQTSDPVTVTITDIDSDPESLILSFGTFSPSLAPASSFTTSGSGFSRSFTFTPAQDISGEGSASLKLIDGAITVQESFDIRVLVPAGITDVPEHLSLDLGDELLVEPTLSGSEVSGIWYHNGQALSASPSTNPVLNISAVTEDESGVYELRVGNDLSEASESFTLTVNSPPEIMLTSNVVTIDEDGALADFTFTISDPDNDVSELNVTGDTLNAALIKRSALTLAGTGGSRTLALRPVADQSGIAVVRLTVSDGRLSASKDLEVTVTAIADPIKIQAIPDQQWAEDDSQTVDVIFSDIETPASAYVVSASSSTPELIADTGLVATGSGTTWALAMTPLENAFGDTDITVSVTDGVRVSEVTFSVEIAPVNDAPTMVLSAAEVIAPINGISNTVTVTVTDIDTAAEDLIFRFKSENSLIAPVESFALSGAGYSRNFTFSPPDGAYGEGAASLELLDGAFSLKESFVVRAVTPPIVTDEPEGAERIAGDSVLFASRAEGYPEIRYQWFQDSSEIPGATNPNLSISDLTTAHTGAYTVVISNDIDSAELGPVQLNVYDPIIISGLGEGGDVATGSDAVLEVEFSGTGPFRYEWYQDGALLDGEVSNTLEITSLASETHNGEYTVKVSNPLTSATSETVTINVLDPPAIVRQPESKTIPAESSVRLSIAANGYEPLSYQWRKDGVAIEGETGAELLLSDLEELDSGEYTVIVENIVGEVSSDPAVLQVTPAVATNWERIHGELTNSNISSLVKHPELGYYAFADGQILFSLDGNHWNEEVSPWNSTARAAVWDSKIVVISNLSVWTKQTGGSWENQAVNVPFGPTWIFPSDNDGLLIVGSSGRVAKTSDLVNWVELTAKVEYAEPVDTYTSNTNSTLSYPIDFPFGGNLETVSLKLDLDLSDYSYARVSLVAPDGTRALVFDDGDVNLNEVTFRDAEEFESLSALGANQSYTGGTFTPAEPFSIFDGKALSGEWELEIVLGGQEWPYNTGMWLDGIWMDVTTTNLADVSLKGLGKVGSRFIGSTWSENDSHQVTTWDFRVDSGSTTYHLTPNDPRGENIYYPRFDRFAVASANGIELRCYDGGLYASSDGGETWQESSALPQANTTDGAAPFYSVRSLHVLGDEFIAAADTSAWSTSTRWKTETAFYSSANGIDWTLDTPVSLPYYSRVNYIAGDASGLLAAGDQGTLLFKPNSGNWERVSDSFNILVENLDTTPEGEVFAFLESEEIMYSADGGDNWMPVAFDIEPDQNRIPTEMVLFDGRVYLYDEGAPQVLYRQVSGRQFEETALVSSYHATSTVEWVVAHEGALLVYLRGGSYVRDLVRSSDGLNWEFVEGASVPDGFDGVVSFAGKLIARDGSTISTSDSGLIWRELSGVLCSELIVAGDHLFSLYQDDLYVTADGLAWEKLTTIGFVKDVFYGYGQYIFVDHYNRVFRSTDALNWTQVEDAIPTNTQLWEGGYIPNGFLLAGRNGAIYRSENEAPPGPELFATLDNPIMLPGGAIALDASAFGDGPFSYQWYRDDELLPGESANSLERQLEHYSDSGVYSVRVTDQNGRSNTFSSQVLVANNFPTDFSEASLSLNDFRFLASGPNEILAREGSVLHRSTDGINWQPNIQRFNELSSTYQWMVYHDGAWLTGARYGSLLYSSPDGLKWSNEQISEECPVDQVVSAGSVLYGIGSQRGIYRSADGRAWTLYATDAPEDLEAIAYHDGTLVAVGRNGLVLRSTDGLIWSQQTLSGAGNFFGLAYSDGLWLAVGSTGYTSADGLNWTSQPIPSTPYATHVLGYAEGFLIPYYESGRARVLKGDSNAANWQSYDLSAYNNSGRPVVFKGTPFLPMRGGHIYRWASGSPAEWSRVLPTIDALDFYGIGALKDRFWFVARTNDGESALFASSDGATWAQVYDFGSLVSSAYVYQDDTGILLSGRNSSGVIALFSSDDDLSTWTPLTMPSGADAFEKVVLHEGYYYGMNRNQIFRSDSLDGSWLLQLDDRFAYNYDDLNDILSADGRLFIVGNEGLLLQRGPDYWSGFDAVDLGRLEHFDQILYWKNQYIIVSKPNNDQGWPNTYPDEALLVSSDGENWHRIQENQSRYELQPIGNGFLASLGLLVTNDLEEWLPIASPLGGSVVAVLGDRWLVRSGDTLLSANTQTDVRRYAVQLEGNGEVSPGGDPGENNRQEFLSSPGVSLDFWADPDYQHEFIEWVIDAEPANQGVESFSISALGDELNLLARFQEAPRAPSISTNYILRDGNLVEGESVTLLVEQEDIDGFPKPELQWYFNDDPIPDATSNVLEFPVIFESNSGSYKLVASNASGSDEVTDEFDVRIRPSILFEGFSQTVRPGENVFFTPQVEGKPDSFTYSWYKDGEQISNSRDLSIRNFQIDDAGEYYLTASNSGGTTESGRRILTLADTVDSDEPSPGRIDVSFRPAVSPLGVNSISEVNGAARLADGSWLLVGRFENDQKRKGISRVLPDGSLDYEFDPGFYVTNDIDGIAPTPDGGFVLWGGSFWLTGAYAGERIDWLAKLKPDLTIDPDFEPIRFLSVGSGNVDLHDVKVDSDGNVWVGGYFTSFIDSQSVTRNARNLARFDAEGDWFTLSQEGFALSGPNDRVFCIEPLGGTLDGALIGGKFTSVGSSSARLIARVNSRGEADTGFASPSSTSISYFDPEIYEILPRSDGSIMVFGAFGDMGGSAQNDYMARLFSDGTVDTSFNSPAYDSRGFSSNPLIFDSFEQSDGKMVFALRSNTGYNGTSVPVGLMRLNMDGSLDVTFTDEDVATDDSVHGFLPLEGGSMVTFGEFQQLGSYGYDGWAVLDADGVSTGEAPEGTFIDGPVHQVLSTSDGKIVAVGDFTRFNGVTVPGIARLNDSGSLDPTFTHEGELLPITTGYDAAIYAVAETPDGGFILGGNFKSFRGHLAYGLLRLHEDGSIDPSFQVPDYLNRMSILRIVPAVGGGYWVAGSFTGYQGVTVNHLVRIHENGALDSSYVPGSGFNGVVDDLDVFSDGRLLVAGRFDTFKGTSRRGYVVLNPDGSLDSERNWPEAASSVYAADIFNDDSVVISGPFYSVGGQSRNELAWLTSGGDLDATRGMSIDYERADFRGLLALPDGRTIVASASDTYVVDKLGQVETPYLSNESFRALALRPDGSLLAGGSFYRTEDVPRDNLVRLEFSEAQQAPVITEHPESGFVKLGNDLLLTVSATGYPAAAYQWYRDGDLLDGETGSSLSIEALEASDYGDYRVRVSNYLGETYSSFATINENTPPTITAPRNMVLALSQASEPFSFSVVDAETATEDLIVQFSLSADPVLLAEGTSLTGSGSERFFQTQANESEVGEATVTLTVTDGELSTSAQFRVAVIVPREVWKERYFSAAQILDSATTADDLDLDGDGFTNLDEYLFGMNPNESSKSPAKVEVDSSGTIYFEYSRPAYTTDVTYTVQCSDNLIEWVELGEGTFLRMEGDMEIWQVEFPPDADCQFMRVNASR